MLRTMCEYFDLDCSNVKGHRKVPYVMLLEDAVLGCAAAVILDSSHSYFFLHHLHE